MAYKRRRRRYGFRRKSYRKTYRRSYRRGFRRYGRTKRNAEHVVSFRRAGQATSITADLDTEFRLAFKFSLENVVDYTKFTSLYEQYRINCVVVKLLMDTPPIRATFEEINTPTGFEQVGIVPNIHVVNDYNDDVTTTITQMTGYGNYRVSKFQGTKTFKVYPKAAQPVWTTLTNTGYGQAKKMWFDANSYQVQHYGLKIGIDSKIPTLIQFHVRTTFYFQCRRIK